jgi:hypothetical protein
MTAAMFTKFDPHAFLENASRSGAPAKVAKLAKARRSVSTLATSATLAVGHAETENFDLDAEEERAAIVQFNGGAPRAWAEALARLDPSKPPADVPSRRWLRFIDDCGRFLDDGWASQAEALGWGPLDLFGCDRERPFARVDHMGLLWLLNGRKLVALTADAAAIETVTGGRLTYRRRVRQIGSRADDLGQQWVWRS